jgi:hypothetical protein
MPAAHSMLSTCVLGGWLAGLDLFRNRHLFASFSPLSPYNETIEPNITNDELDQHFLGRHIFFAIRVNRLSGGVVSVKLQRPCFLADYNCLVLLGKDIPIL